MVLLVYLVSVLLMLKKPYFYHSDYEPAKPSKKNIPNRIPNGHFLDNVFAFPYTDKMTIFGSFTYLGSYFPIGIRIMNSVFYLALFL